jgi:predicted GNAT family acetyltransferase
MSLEDQITRYIGDGFKTTGEIRKEFESKGFEKRLVSQTISKLTTEGKTFEVKWKQEVRVYNSTIPMCFAEKDEVHKEDAAAEEKKSTYVPVRFKIHTDSYYGLDTPIFDPFILWGRVCSDRKTVLLCMDAKVFASPWSRDYYKTESHHCITPF